MVEMVGSLSAGSIATLLEFFAIAMGLVIAANLQAIVTLGARRKLFVKGRATLRDSTWGVGITDGLGNPRRLFRDCRSFFAFALAVVVLLLEGLTVFQTQPGESCSFRSESTWTVEEQELGCFERTPAVLLGAISIYFSRAIEKVADVDVNVGLPVNTDVFEDSVLTGASVQSLKSREKRYIAPIERADSLPSVSVKRNGISLREAKAEGEDLQIVDCPGSAGKFAQQPQFAPLDLEILDNNDVASDGFVMAQGCLEVLAVAICHHARKEFSLVDESSVEASCDRYSLGMEGAYIDDHSQLVQTVAMSRKDGKDINEEDIRRARLANIVARNSASNTKCKRFIAAPKPCTEIGTVSLVAVSLLGVIFLATTVVRLLLMKMVSKSVDWNSDQQRLVRSIFEHFEAVPRSYKPKRDDDIHISVLSSTRDVDQFHLAWTREPVQVEPARMVERDRVIPTVDAHEDDDELPLV